MAVIIQLRRGDAASWTTNNPTLAVGEMGVETDTGKFKVGDGTTAWDSLAYSSGEDGVYWYSGEGAPGEEFGQDDDFYLDTETGDVYLKDGTWSVAMNIEGSIWYTDDREPSAGDGKDHDVWLHTDTHDLWWKDDGTWGVVTNIKGADGSVWHSGTGEPGAELGQQGDYYLDTDNGDVYWNDGSWSMIMNIMGENDAENVSFDNAETDICSETVQGAIEELDAREIPDPYKPLTEEDDVTGDFTLDFSETPFIVVNQGEGELTYLLESLVPVTITHQYVDWDPDVWEFGDGSEYPTLKEVN